MLIGLAGLRVVLAVVAIPLAPILYEDHFAILVLMRPTKEVLLAAGFFIREGDVSLLPVIVASLPLLLPGVWLFYLLAQAFSSEIRRARLPWLAGRLLPPKRIREVAATIERHGARFILFGRLAAFPSSVVAAAAGAARVKPRLFLLVDTAGALLSLALLVGVGYGAGEAHEEAGPWVTALGVAVVVALAIGLGRYLRRMSTTK